LEDVEEVACLGDVLSAVLPGAGGGGRLPWDAKGQYSTQNVDVFYKANACQPVPLDTWGARDDILAGDSASFSYDEPTEHLRKSQWVRVPPAAPLLLPMVQPNYVVADIPVFYVVARSSPLYAEMRQRGFAELRVPEM
jgi:hypothetical protein